MKLKYLLAAFASVVSFTAAGQGGIPTFRGSDHIGVTVPDLDEAVKFFVEVMGCEAFYKMGPFKADDDWMAVHLGVPARAEIPQMQLVRCGLGTNLELLQYKVADQVKAMPKNSDLGGYHVAFYVDDMDKAVGYLKAKGVKFLGEPTVMTAGPSAGETWGYFLSPWGMNLELVSYPRAKPTRRVQDASCGRARDPRK